MKHEFTLPVRVTEIVRGQDGHRPQASPTDTRKSPETEEPPKRPPGPAPTPPR